MSRNCAMMPEADFMCRWQHCDGEVDEDSFQLRPGAKRRGRSIERTVQPQPIIYVPVKVGDMVQVIANKGVLEALLLTNGYQYNSLIDLMLGGTYQTVGVHPEGNWVVLPSPGIDPTENFIAFPRQAVKKLPEPLISPLVVREFVVRTPNEDISSTY